MVFQDARIDYKFSTELFPNWFPSSTYLRALCAPAFVRTIAQPYSLVNVHGTDCVLLGRGKKCITTLHGLETDLADSLRLARVVPSGKYAVLLSVGSLKQRLALKRSDFVFAVSNHIARRVTSMRNDVKVWITPNGVDTGFFRRANSEELSRMSRRFGLREEDQVILFVGRAHIVKGMTVLPKIVRRIVHRVNNAKFVLAGDSSAKFDPWIPSDVRRSCLCVGKVDDYDLRGLYSLARVQICPSLYEPFGLVCLEAMSCGTPVVCFNNGGPSDFVADGINGALVDPFDVEEFAERTIQFASDEGFRRKASAEAIRTVVQYDWSCTQRKLRQSFQEVLSELGYHS